ncbi:hypothetical protein KHC28_10345 [Ancylobacter sonchi]|uniref:hypothetical protein n=1 Tax=Ancylobacter sonchi TaxID=1937790 RepID=UPI001BD5ACDC|nr:hypothetical protein [Ancylobacter sonchi]MBS7534056.1 hypothetical protein [Ancylobacter sonchi]
MGFLTFFDFLRSRAVGGRRVGWRLPAWLRQGLQPHPICLSSDKYQIGAPGLSIVRRGKKAGEAHIPPGRTPTPGGDQQS